MPALFTSPAMVPSFASTVSNRRTTSGSLATSAWTAIALRLKARTSATTAPAAASFARKFTHTSWPRSAARRAVAAPIPRLAPVMTTTDIASRGFGDAPALSPFDLLHNFQRLRDIVCGTQVADGGSDRPIRLHDERGALGEAMVDLVAARVLGARLGFADLEVVALRDLAVCVGGHRNLAGTVLRVSRELVQRRNLVECHPDDAGTRGGKLVAVLGERVRLEVAAAG